tara:strand:+ start:279 stop:824 length:546 start_codon:yes stop_codon:yes gene_type:complete
MNLFEINLHLEKPAHLNQIYFGMGCFWGAEKKFWHLDGLYTTAVGYAGGLSEKPSYETVCTGSTGHAEVVKVIYDSKITSLDDLLKIFWESHDPTQLNRQGNDIGTQYRSIIFSESNKEIEILEDSKNKFQEALKSSNMGTVQTEIKLLKKFYLAEEYHQKYLYKNPNGYCGLKGTGIPYI